MMLFEYMHVVLKVRSFSNMEHEPSGVFLGAVVGILQCHTHTHTHACPRNPLHSLIHTVHALKPPETLHHKQYKTFTAGEIYMLCL